MVGRVGASSRTSPKIIAPIGKGRVRESHVDEYTGYLRKNCLRRTDAIDGNLGAQMLLKVENGVAGFTVIPYRDPDEAQEAIRKIAGNDVSDARLLARDREYLIDPSTSVQYYDVLANDWKKHA